MEEPAPVLCPAGYRNNILFMPTRSLSVVIPAVLGLYTAPLLAGETILGPVAAEVVRVIDGDTFVADAHVWPGQKITVSVRIRGVDAPEMRSRCGVEKAAARNARDKLEALIGGTVVQIRNVSGDKYFGRVLADVATEQGLPVAESLLEQALARAYHGGQRISYCG